MRKRLGLAVAAAVAALAAPAQQEKAPMTESVRPIVIGHRGASGHRPEHTLESYRLAIEMGADYIEPDLVPTKDGHFVARHESEIASTTDVATKPQFAARKAKKSVDGNDVEGFFTEDFTLAEIKTLRAKERVPQLRPQNTQYDGRFEVPTLEEVIELAQRESKARGRTIGIYPELKHPSYFEALGHKMGKKLVEILHAKGYRGPKAPVFIQCFEVSPLRELRPLTELPLVQLLEDRGRPWDFTIGRFARTYADLTTPAGLKDIAAYAQAIGAHKALIVPRDASGRTQPPTSLVRDAHAAGLKVHAWTFRNEDFFLPADLKGNPAAEYALFLGLGIDGLFSDFPDAAVRAREAAAPRKP
jgi:glycerophosphoryl diester phosphodiesterase